jgi:sarcosine oxidase
MEPGSGSQAERAVPAPTDRALGSPTDGTVDVVVVGAGLMGAATAWAATRAGLQVHVVEQFEPGHDRGSSHGSARIIRRAYADPFYTRLSGRAFELWREVERESETPLLRILGGLDFGSTRDVTAVAAGLTEVGAAHELLEPTEAERRWPGMRFDGPVVYHAEAGTLDAERAVAAMIECARRRGAEIRYGVAVRAVRPLGDGRAGARVDLVDGSRLVARQVVIAAGAWVPDLLDGLVPMPPLRVTQQQIFHFPRLDTSVAPWPSVIHQLDGHGIYHLAGGRDGGTRNDRKIGEHDFGRRTTADTRDGVVDPSSRDRVVDYVQRWLPGLEPRPRSAGTCLYTSTASEDFIVDRVGPFVVCSPCSGHGAKFAPLIGELCAGLVTGSGEVPERFRLRAHAQPTRSAVSL